MQHVEVGLEPLSIACNRKQALEHEFRSFSQAHFEEFEKFEKFAIPLRPAGNFRERALLSAATVAALSAQIGVRFRFEKIKKNRKSHSKRV